MGSLAAVNVASFVSAKLGRGGYSYETWSEQMLCLLESQGLIGFIDGTAPRPENCDDAWRQTDWLIKGWILGSLSDKVTKTVVKLHSARAVWNKLKYKFSETRSTPPTPPPPPPTYKGREWDKETKLYRSALRGDWHAAKHILDQDRNAIKSSFGLTSETAIHVAAGGKNPEFLQELLDLVPDDSFVLATNNLGDNPLHIAAAMGNYQAAEMLVTRYPNLLYHSNCSNEFPHHAAANYSHRKILQLLISKTDYISFVGDGGISLLHLMIETDLFDTALDLVEKYSYLVWMNPQDIGTVLFKIAVKATAFCIDDQLSFWKRPIYWCILKMKMEPQSSDIENQTSRESPWWRKIVLKLHSILCQVIEYLDFHSHQKKVLREKAQELMKCLCEHIKSLDYENASAICRDTILAVAESGNRDVVEAIVEIFPLAIYFTNSSKQNFMHLAVKNRCERVFNLLYQSKNSYSNTIDNCDNSILHLVAHLAPPHKLNLVSGAALQMQRELQWFEEASKFVTPYTKQRRNKNGKTAKMLFTEEHRELKIEAEKWMKDTANSCTIAAALIATVMFAAAITVPGGNQSESGYPMFNKLRVFTTFAVLDAVSLFTSTTSLLMFLSILTSRYAEQDFLHKLPNRLCIGLSTLFVSILAMMIAFGLTLYLVFWQKKAWVLEAVGALTCVPICLFGLMQYPLFRDVISSTYGRGIFGKQSDLPFP